MLRLLACLALLVAAHAAQAAEADLYCLTGTNSQGNPIWAPASTAQPCPTTGGGGGGGNVTIVAPLGQTTSSGSLPVVLPSDMGALAVKQPDVTATGQTINSASTSNGYAITLGNGVQSVAFHVTGLTASGATLTIQESADGGTTWVLPVVGFKQSTTPAVAFTTLTTDQDFFVNTAGATNVRLQVTSTGSGTITVASVATVGIAGTVPLAASATGATGSAIPATASLNGLSSGGNLVGAVGCNNHTFQHITSATDTLLVQGVTSQTVKLCGVVMHFSGSAAQAAFIENTASTNANCSSTKTQIGAVATGNSTVPSSDGFYNPIWGGFANTSGNGVCVNTTGTGGVDVEVWYTQGS
jgi:hypothetical protein